jgi:hypothetical protein
MVIRAHKKLIKTEADPFLLLEITVKTIIFCNYILIQYNKLLQIRKLIS